MERSTTLNRKAEGKMFSYITQLLMMGNLCNKQIELVCYSLTLPKPPLVFTVGRKKLVK